MWPIKSRWMRRMQLYLSALCIVAGIGGWTALNNAKPASAHPLGDFTVNRYSRLELSDTEIGLFYVVDWAEVAAFQERERIDANDDDTLDSNEIETYLSKEISTIAENLHLQLDGTRLNLTAIDSSLDFPPGQGGLNTQRLTARFVATLPAQPATWQIDYRDDNYADRIGWREVVVQAGPEVTLLESDAPTEDLSQALTAYPEDGTQLNTNSATLRFEPIGFSGATDGSVSVSATNRAARGVSTARSQDPFAQLINRSLSDPLTVVFVLLASMFWGAAHALTPGHGKTIVAAYLVGSRGTVGHALILGLTTTVTHTLGVFILGFITLFASRYILPEQLYPWLGVMSGALVVGIGFMLLRSYYGRFKRGADPQPVNPGHHHQHGEHHHHDHGHDHDHAHDHHHDHGHDHIHDHEHDHTHDHSHDHDHHHDHSHTQDHDHGHDHAHEHDHDHDHEHDHGEIRDGVFYHSHGDGPAHAHVLPTSDKLTWGGLLALGVSGGLIPCPSALVVMLSAIALQRIGFGLILIVMFSIGLAGVLVAIGILWVKAADLLEGFSKSNGLLSRIPWKGRVVQLLPAASAAFIIIVGLGITLQALSQTGLVSQ